MAKKKIQPNVIPYQKLKEEEKDFIPELIILVGISGCGKSTFAKNLAENQKDQNDKTYIILSSDEIREELTGDASNQEQNEEVFKILHRHLKENLRLKNSVIIDATNLKLKNRRAYLNAVKKLPCKKRVFIFAVPLWMCEDNQTKRELQVPKEALKRQEMSFEIPFFEEGYDEINIVNMLGQDMLTTPKPIQSIKTLRDSNMFKRQIGFDQRTKHHLYTLDEHSIRVAKAIHNYGVPYKLVQNNDELYDYFQYSKALLEEVAYVHDYGKLMVGKPKDDGSGDYKYFNHHNVSAYELLVKVRLLGLTRIDFIIDFLFYVNYHMQPFFINTPKAEKKWREIFGNWKYEMLTIFNKCDIIGSGTQKERIGVN